MRRACLAVLAAGLTAALVPAARAASPDWGSLGWLVGHWEGEGGGTQAGSGRFSFLPDVGDHVLVRRNVSDYPPQNGRPASHHEDLMVVFREAGQLKATYWDAEDHTIHYDIRTGPDSVAFVSEEAPGPLYRLTYRRTAKGLEGQFEVAAPNSGARFKSYLTWTAHRVAPR